jgi:ribose 5-phosphate isomerase B
VRVGIATDHGGFGLKEDLRGRLAAAGHDVVEFGAFKLDPSDDYPDFVLPLARAVAAGNVERGVAVCGRGVGATVSANKVPGARACLITDHFSARQGVEDDHMNIMCLGGRITGPMLAWDLVEAFLDAEFSQVHRHLRRLGKVAALETRTTSSVGEEAARRRPSNRVDRVGRPASPEIRLQSLALSGWSDAICHGRHNMNIREQRPRRQS